MKKEWKRTWKKVVAFALVFVMAMSAGLLMPQGTDKVQAAEQVYINPFSDKVVTYKPGDNIKEYYTVISIVGCSKKSEIKNLKSSNKNIKVEPQNGYIECKYGDKAGKTKVTCTVKGVKLSTTLTVKKYTSPLKSFKVGNKDYTAKYKNSDKYYQTKDVKNQKVSIAVKSGWQITGLHIYDGKDTTYSYPRSSRVSRKVTLKGSYAYVSATIKNQKTGVREYIYFYKTK